MTTAIRSEASRSVIVVNGADKLAINEDGSMEILSPAANPEGNDIPTAGQLPFTKFYESPAQTIAAAAGATFAHGLGAIPKMFSVHLVCITAQGGYSPGEIIPVGINALDAGTNAGVAVAADATNLKIRFGNRAPVFFALDIATGGGVNLTNTNFSLVVRAWA